MTRLPRVLHTIAAVSSAGLLPGCGASSHASGPSPASQTVLFLGVELPAAGSMIGGDSGAGYTTRADYALADSLKTRWTMAERRRGEGALRRAGVRVQAIDGARRGAQPLEGVRFGLSGRVRDLALRARGAPSGAGIDAQLNVAWSLLDVAGDSAVLGREVHGGSRIEGTVDEAIAHALDDALETVLRDSTFLLALREGPPAALARAASLRARLAPRDVPPIMILDVNLPQAGATIGGHFEGVAGRAARTASIQLSDGARERWARAVRAAGDSLLGAAGFRVATMGPPTSDAAPLGNVRFGLSAEVTSLSVTTTGRVSPVLVEARAETVWEVMDLAAGGSILTMRTSGSARLDDSLDLGAIQAMTRTLGQLIADTVFQAALTAPLPQRLEDVIFAPEWARALPGPFDTVRIAPGDLNSSRDPDPIQRVAHGVFAVHGTGAGSVTAFTITRDGLALASGVPVRERRLWGRFHDGADRPVRILRARDDVMLLEIKCTQPCETVPWSDSAIVAEERVFTLAGPRYAGDALYLAYGRVRPQSGAGDRGDLEFRSDGDVDGGEPIARRQDGTVVALAAKGRALPFTAALRQLGMALDPAGGAPR